MSLRDLIRETRDFVPAMAIAVLVTAALAGAMLFPVGKTILLVRLPQEGVAAALTAAALADVVFVSIPAPGYAVLYGEASQVRRALGLAVPWKGNALCSPTS